MRITQNPPLWLISTYFSHSGKYFVSLTSSWQRCVEGLYFSTQVYQPLTTRFTRSNDFQWVYRIIMRILQNPPLWLFSTYFSHPQKCFCWVSKSCQLCWRRLRASIRMIFHLRHYSNCETLRILAARGTLTQNQGFSSVISSQTD